MYTDVLCAVQVVFPSELVWVTWPEHISHLVLIRPERGPSCHGEGTRGNCRLSCAELLSAYEGSYLHCECSALRAVWVLVGWVNMELTSHLETEGAGRETSHWCSSCRVSRKLVVSRKLYGMGC